MISKPVKIAVVDDHKMFLDGLVHIFKSEKNVEITNVSYSAKNLLDFLGKNTVDIVISDLDMPEISGLELIRVIKKKYKKIKILIMSMHNQGSLISQMVKEGVDGYVIKDAGKEELLNAITALSENELWFGNQVKSSVNDYVKGFNFKKKINTEISEREKEVLELIAKEYTQQEIAEKLYISINTVMFHRKNLLAKFGARNSVGLITKAISAEIIKP